MGNKYKIIITLITFGRKKNKIKLSTHGCKYKYINKIQINSYRNIVSCITFDHYNETHLISISIIMKHVSNISWRLEILERYQSSQDFKKHWDNPTYKKKKTKIKAKEIEREKKK